MKRLLNDSIIFCDDILDFSSLNPVSSIIIIFIRFFFFFILCSKTDLS